MKERPIVFSTEMVKAILEGRKTMTRRRMNPQPLDVMTWRDCWVAKLQDDPPRGKMIRCRCGQVGDRLWVRETFCEHSTQGIVYRADHPESPLLWRPSIHMPRWASRITLEIVSLRAARLQEITEEDARAEGCQLIATSIRHFELEPEPHFTKPERPFTHRDHFIGLWDSLNAKHPWESNPWVWVIGFKIMSKEGH